KTPAPIDGLAFSPDGKLIANGNGNLTVSVWETATGKEKLNLPAEQCIATNAQALAFAPDGSTLATGGFGDERIGFWDLTTGKELRSFRTGKPLIFAIAFSPDGKTLATTDLEMGIRLWDVATGKQLEHWDGSMYSVSFAADGKSLAWTC